MPPGPHPDIPYVQGYVQGISNAIQIADALDISLDVLAGREERVRYSESVPNVYVSQLNDCMNGLSENECTFVMDVIRAMREDLR